MSRRIEFNKPTKRAALERSGGYCEGLRASLGYLLGLSPRCNSPLEKAVEFDHILACSNGGDNSLENCQCLCKQCHKEKTGKVDIPRAAKIKRQSDKHNGIKRKYNWPKRKFGQ